MRNLKKKQHVIKDLGYTQFNIKSLSMSGVEKEMGALTIAEKKLPWYVTTYLLGLTFDGLYKNKRATIYQIWCLISVV